MLDQLSYVSIVYAALVTIGAAVVFLVRRARPKLLDTAAWILEGLLVLRALAGAGTLLHGERAAEQAPYIGYLIASVCIVPIAMNAVSEDRSPWSSAVIAVVGLALTVIAARILMTWGGGAHA
jgi:drug/metabolite transporter superfamily protein YnfA